MPGMEIEFIEKIKLNSSQCIMIGDIKVANTFANRCGVQFVHAEDFLKG
jgi:hypothetical protein